MKNFFAVLTVVESIAFSVATPPQANAQSKYFGEVGTVTSAAGAATLDRNAGVVTTESLTTAAGANYTLTITDNKITTASLVLVDVNNGTNTTVAPIRWTVTPANGSVAIVVKNIHASAALNGTLKVSYFVYP